MSASSDPSPRASESTSDDAVLRGSSAHAVDLVRAVERAATARCVVVRGPSGSGRSSVARALHRASGRSAPLVEVRCAGLMGSFGHERLLGTVDRPGLIAAASGGSLVLAGVEDLDEELQLVLAGVLAEGEFLPLGGRALRALDARVIAITGSDELERALVPELAYRLNDSFIDVQPLVRRTEDLGDIAQALLDGVNPTMRLGAGARQTIEALPWIGGLDELADLLERAAHRAGSGEIESAHLEAVSSLRVAERSSSIERSADGLGSIPAPFPAPALDALPLGDRSWKTVERALIQRVIEESGGNRSLAARVLGFNRSTLYNKLRQYGLVSEERAS